MIKAIPTFCLFLALTATFGAGCGGGGGGGDAAVGAARVKISTSPRRFDVADRTTVEIEIRDIHPDGIALKVRYPDALAYVPGSSALEVDGRSLDASPDFNDIANSQAYLVFLIQPGQLGDDNKGTLQFQLVARSELTEGTIEVDPDVDETGTFDADNPEFSEEGQVTFVVVG